MDWGYKELFAMLLLILVAVPIVIENIGQSLLQAVFQNSLYAGTLTGLVMAVVFMYSLYIIALRPKQLKWIAVGLRPLSRKDWKVIVGGFLLLLVMSIIILIIMDAIQIGVDNSKTEALKDKSTWFTLSIAFISAAIISPIYEEILYRGFLYKWFRLKWGKVSGIFLSSLIFMIVHIPTYNTLPVNFVSGVILAWSYEKSGSVMPGIIIHGLFNGMAVILTATSS
ncbi:integral membrane protein [Mycobacteroides abscessus subsp. abscessus]|nr:integral membrane protein [Mycobacteroides abscessus subsp. abscessus]